MLAVQAALAFVPLPIFGQAWIGIPNFFVGSLLLVVRPPVSWAVLVAFGVLIGFVQAGISADPLDVAYSAVTSVTFALAVSGLTQLARLVVELHAARAELAGRAVADERVRFARDLHDLLGLSLSAITLKGQVAHRLARTDPDQALKELTEVLAIARRALGDVRTVAGGYAELSLEEECDSAESILAAAQVDVRIEREYGDLTQPVRTVLATVLREGITNVMRHSKVQRCAIAVRQRDGVVTIDIRNDGVAGVEASPGRGAGCGIRNLSDRVAELGGKLTAGLEPDRHWFRLHATIPVTAGGGGPPTGAERWPALPSVPATPVELPRRPDVPRPTPLITLVLSGRFVAAVIQLLYLTVVPWHVALAVATMTVLLVLQLGHFSRMDPRVRRGSDLVLLAVQAALVYLPLAALGPAWVSIPGFLAGSAMLVLRAALGWGVFFAVLGSVAWITQAYSADPLILVFNLAATTITGLLVYGLTWLSWLLTELDKTHAELARMAVAEERLRFARDLHDLLGLSLSAITLKSELILRLIRTDPAKAEDELANVLELAWRASADVRMAASGYREPFGDDPGWIGRAADAIVELELRHGELPVHVRTVLVGLLRTLGNRQNGTGQGANGIVLRRSENTVYLDVLDASADADVDAIAELVTALGGDLTTSSGGAGRIQLTVTVPV
ncbi:MAG TPA: histidine kinase [Actinophytocola sp.]|uniref:sensor histidine kinase n=1 Tax=Actinophytocola sp. TaxID=1872138 RepID=UPI002DDCD2D2|nr:histidine kinase [Actinophytocola sp.]HEV2781374.1 histidine kinase [Actinophytocola sp.]